MVRIAGPINQQTISSFQQRLEGVLRERCFTLTLDLGAAEYLDSDGVRWLQQLQAALHSANGDVRLTVREGSRIHRTVCLLQLDRSFSVASYPDGPDSQDAPSPCRLTTAQ
jgi:anti-anti-sigma regulatory factor